MESVPQELKDRLIVKRYSNPTLRKVASIAMKDETVSEEQKQKLQTLKEAGYFDKKEPQVNKSVQDKIDKYINNEIAKSILAGRLPEPKSNTLAAKYVKKCHKAFKKHLLET